jgi:hypothetical protein
MAITSGVLVYLRNLKEDTMNFLEHLGILGLAVGVSLPVAASAQARSPGLTITPVSNATLTAPVRNASGVVKSMVGRVLTLNTKGRDMTFLVDENTHVVARGGGTAALLSGGTLPVTDIVRRGDVTRVEYRELDGTMRASAIRISARNAAVSR